MHPYRAIATATAGAALVALLHLLGALDPRATIADPPSIDEIVHGHFVR